MLRACDERVFTFRYNDTYLYEIPAWIAFNKLNLLKMKLRIKGQCESDRFQLFINKTARIFPYHLFDIATNINCYYPCQNVRQCLCVPKMFSLPSRKSKILKTLLISIMIVLCINLPLNCEYFSHCTVRDSISELPSLVVYWRICITNDFHNNTISRIWIND